MYCSLAQLKVVLGNDETLDDPLLTTLINRSQSWIESETRRKFESLEDTTRLYSIWDTSGLRLFLDEDLCQITEIAINTDATEQILDTNQYTVFPRNRRPYQAIDLRHDSSVNWKYTSNPDSCIRVLGRWAFSITPPEDIVHATLRLASFLYRQKDTSIFDTVAQPEIGMITTPSGMPKDVKLILSNYKKARI